MRVLITGMPGTGKSAVVAELRRRGCTAYDADDDGYSEPSIGGAWRWRADAVADLLASADIDVLFFAGCSEEQAGFAWDRKALLTAPETVLVDRLRTRTTNTYGKTAAEMAHVLADRREVEPVLRATADVVIDTTQPLKVVVDLVLAAVREAERE